jgi:RimJ/RimL family protein N-acetyltransferase
VPPSPTQRLVFRVWSADDRALAELLWGDARVTARIGGGAPLARLEAELAQLRDHGVQYWPMFLRDGGDLVGCSGLRPREPARRVFELGFHLRPVYWGQGLALEAARAVIAHASSALGASALFAGHHPENAASRALLAKLGFTAIGSERYPPTGLDHPAYGLALTADR